MMKIKKATFYVSSAKLYQCPNTKFAEYAFIGRSNVGKSSLINALTNHRGLAMTSSTPGKTMLINHFLINDDWFIVDLPGYGYAKRGKKMMQVIREMIENYVLHREQLTNLFVLIDSRLEPQKIDLDFLQWLGENSIPFSIVFTKADKNKPGVLKQNVNKFLNKLQEEWEELPPYFITSSETKFGIAEILSYISQINHSLIDQAND